MRTNSVNYAGHRSVVLNGVEFKTHCSVAALSSIKQKLAWMARVLRRNASPGILCQCGMKCVVRCTLMAVVIGAFAVAPFVAAAQTLESPALDMRETLVTVPVSVKDANGRIEPINMPLVVYRPAGEGKFPVIVFNHGRAYGASARAAQGLNRPEDFARLWVEKGFVVLAPTRAGYGPLAQGIDPESPGGCGDVKLAPGAVAAADQVWAAVEYARVHFPFVDATRWLVAGQSVGGLATVATVSRNPPGLLGGINFAGGIGCDTSAPPGQHCTAKEVGPLWKVQAGAAKAPMLWLYWKNDQCWGDRTPVQWHADWVQGGAQAELRMLAPYGSDGHSGQRGDLAQWIPEVDRFVAQWGIPAHAFMDRPTATEFANLNDATKVPLSERNQGGYAKFLAMPKPRVIAISDRGGYAMGSGSYAWWVALSRCQRYGNRCAVYAVDDSVVWTGRFDTQLN